MKNKIKKVLSLLFCLSILVMLCGCNLKYKSPTTTEEAKKVLKYRFYEIEDDVTDLSFLEGYPWLNTSIVGVMGKIKKPSVKDDFYAYANYDYLKDYKLPAGKSKGGSYVFEGEELADKRVTEILNDPNSSLYKINSLLTSGDKEAVKADIEKAMNYTDDDIKRIFKSKEMFYQEMNQLEIQDDEDSYYISLSSDSNDNLLLFYSKVFEENKQDDYARGLAEIIKEEGIIIDNPEAFIKENLDELMKLYNASKSLPYEDVYVEVKDLPAEFNTGLFDMKTALNELGIQDEKEIGYSNNALGFVKALNEYVNEHGYELVKNMIVLSKMFYYRYYIGSENYLKLYRDKLSKIACFKDASIIDSTVASDITRKIAVARYFELLSKEYALRYANNKTRDAISSIIEEVISEYKLLLSENDWLSEETKNNAIEKLEAMTYVTYFEDGLLETEDFVSNKNNLICLGNDYYDYSLSYYPLINTDYMHYLAPYVCNAAYFPYYNCFVITHAVVSTYIDNENLSKEFLYGSIGNTIGHEISHAFDYNGSLYDKNGDYNNWWTDEDRKAFNERVNKLIKYYDDNLSSLADAKIKGYMVNGEVTADLGGLKVMLRLAAKIENFDYNEFFLAYANDYGFVYTREKAYLDVQTNPHPLSYLRVNMAFAQFDIFQQIYDIHEGDGMYIVPEDRICVW